MASLRYDAASAQCLLWTYKEGLFAAVGHDLLLRLARFELQIDEEKGEVTGRFDASTLTVVDALRGGAPARGALSERDRREIEKAALREVLDADHQPEIHFTSSEVARGGLANRGSAALTNLAPSTMPAEACKN